MKTEYQVTQPMEGIYQIANKVGNCCTLVVGEEKAILFDTMCGIGDLRGCVEELTNLPLIVINSHGHYDHIGGNYQFEAVYLNRLDWPSLDMLFPFLDEIQSNMGVDLSDSRESYVMGDRVRDIAPGTVFALGNITAEVIALPGHTPGSIGLLLREKRLLLVGDAVSAQMCLFFPDSLDIEVYRATLRRLMQMDFDFFLQGHYLQLFSRQVLQKFWDCALLPDKKRGYPYRNTQIPEMKGLLYMLSLRDPEIDDMICIITKDRSMA